MSSSLLVLAPLRLEAVAVDADGGRMRVLRCGMGLERARVAAARALAVEDAVAVAIAGVCAAAAPALRPGDVVLGTELRRQDGPPVAVPGSALLAAALRRHGLRVHVGPIACVDRVLSPTERRGLGARGALAVDMESAWLAGGAGGRPLVVMRVVVERSDRSLHDPRTAAAGIRALASLRRASAALSEWAAAVGPRRLLLAGPRSFCAAVAREAELVLVASSHASADAQRLVAVARREGTPAHLVEGERNVDLAWLTGVATIGITAAASAPEGSVEGLVTALGALGPVEIAERVTTAETPQFRHQREVALR